MATDDDILKDAKQRFQEGSDAQAENIRLALDDLRFARLGEQWPDAVKKQRELEGRPCLTINRLPAFIRQVVNDSRMNKPSIKVHPVDSGSDPETAEILQGLIKNIEVQSGADMAYDTALDFAVTGGIGYFRIDVDYAHDDTFEQDICIKRVEDPLAIVGDKDSTAGDSSDWKYAFVPKYLTKDDYAAKYGKRTQSDWDAMGGGAWMHDGMACVTEYWDRTEEPSKIVLLNDGQVWKQKDYLERKELFDALGFQVVKERETITNKVTQYVISGSEVLSTTEWKGRYIPIVPVYGEEIYIDGKRHWISLVRYAKDPQMMFNFWRTASTELVALAPKAPFIGPKGAFVTDGAKWASANTQSHSFIEYDGNTPPQRQPFAGVPAGALQEALNASDDMKAIMGIHDASLGSRSNETSGRAILARQREGDVSTFHFIDNLSRSIRHAGRIIVDLIPHIYSAERVLRVIGDDESVEMVKVNQDPQKAQAEAMESGKEIAKIYDLTVGKYDVTVATGPSFTTQREEAANSMVEFIRAYPPAAPIIGDLLAKNLDWPGADDMAKRMKAMLPPNLQDENNEITPQAQAMLQQAQAQMQQLQAQLQQGAQAFEKLRSEHQGMQADNQADMIAAQVKVKEAELKEQELRIKAFDAETARLKVTLDAQAAEKQMRFDIADKVAQSGNIVSGIM
jgi:hypothetical protein